MHKLLHTKHKRKIAYNYTKGKYSFGIIFFSGFKSDMKGSKAQYIYKWCKENNVECTIFDYSGHGNSSEDFINCDISNWIEDGMDIISEITTNPQILIGSSMGAWIAIKIALLIPKKIKGIITIAAAPDFTKILWENILDQKQKENMLKNGHISIKSHYDKNGYVITKKLINSGNKNLILNDALLSFNFPIKLLHGAIDAEVNWSNSLDIFNKINSNDAELIIIKNGDHRLSSENNLKTLIDTTNSLISIIK